MFVILAIAGFGILLFCANEWVQKRSE